MDRYLTPEQVLEILPGMTRQGLATLRFRGEGPRFYKPSPRKVLYLESDVRAYIESTVRQSTRELA